MKNLALLLSTYNGEEHLEDLLQSLILQTYPDFMLFIRDDGSTDNTITIIENYMKKHSNIVLVESGGNIGVKMSFSELLKLSLEFDVIEYIMFVDQDDFWLPNKIELSLNKIMNLQKSNPHIPILVHTDLIVTDSNFKTLSSSFWKYQNLDFTRDSLNDLLTQNVITGCTIIINKNLASLSFPIPKDAIMHDWWISLIASGLGIISCVDQPTIYYKQHQNNSIGAKKFNLIYIIDKLFHSFNFKKNINQAITFLETYQHLLERTKKEMLCDFIRLEKSNYIDKLRIITQYKFYKHGVIRNIAFLIKISRL